MKSAFNRFAVYDVGLSAIRRVDTPPCNAFNNLPLFKGPSLILVGTYEDGKVTSIDIKEIKAQADQLQIKPGARLLLGTHLLDWWAENDLPAQDIDILHQDLTYTARGATLPLRSGGRACRR